MIEQLIKAQPSVNIMDDTDSELTQLCLLGRLVACLPSVRIIRLDPQQERVHLVTSEERVATQIDDLIQIIGEP